MKPRGLSSPDLRKRNRAEILRLIHRHGGLARNDLAKALGLTRASITYLVNELMADGLVAEGGSSEADGKVGRRKVSINVVPGAGLVLGLGLDVERLQLVLTDLSGAVLDVRNLASPASPQRRGDEVVGELARLAASTMAAMVPKPKRNKLIGAGFTATGRVDSDAGVSLREPRLWSGPAALREPLEKALGIRVAVDNNVRALALAETLLTGARQSPPPGHLFVKYGPGVGAAWAAGGAPWPGAHYRSGELGHTLVENDGPSCAYCGRKGCLESLVSATALAGLAEARGGPGGRIEDLCASLEAEDPEAFALLARRFARAIGNAIELCDPSVVTLYGAPFQRGRLFEEVAGRVESNERPCEIRRSGLDTELPALGAAALALDRFFFG